MKPHLENAIEKAVGSRLTKWAQRFKMDLFYLKLNIIGTRGFPDRIILWPTRNVLFVEFKRPGELPTKMQLYIHSQLRKLGFEVQVHDDIETAVESIQKAILSSAGAGTGNEANCSRSGSPSLPSSRKGKDGDGS